MTVLNLNKFNHTTQPMFFGEELGIARFETVKYLKIEDLTEKQHGFFWRPSEISLSKDRHDFKYKMTDIDKRIFISNLQYQIMLDSVQGRSPLEVFLPICSLPEVEAWIEAWSFFEGIHSKSYTHIIRNIFDNPSEVFEGIIDIPEIVSRGDMITSAYDELHEYVLQYKLGQDVNTYDMKLALFKCMISVYGLESIRFYVSFACSYSFNERGLMEGNSKIIRLINRDEYLHQGTVHFILTRWLKGLDDPEMTKIARENIHLIKDILVETAEQEIEWGKWLFKDGSVLGLNEKLITSEVQYLTDNCLTSLGEEAYYGVKDNPLPWMDNYTQSSKVQLSPQETELSGYIVGGLDSNIDDTDDFEM